MAWGRYLNLIYHWITKDLDREGVAKFDAELAFLSVTAAPEPGLPRRPGWAIPPAGVNVDAGTFAMAAAAALGVAG